MNKIYMNGEFITLENKEIEAILVEDGKIKKTGTKDEILKLKDEETKIIDLEEKTMMPAFIDPHSHFFAVANSLLQVSLEKCKSIKEIQDELLKYKNENHIEEGKWIIACGYDHNLLVEKRHITKKELDEIIPNNPIIIHHKSGHNGVLNSKGLEWLNITKETIPPFGGKIEKINDELTGYLEENAFIEVVKKIPMANLEDLVALCERAQKKYASYGITSIQEGMMVKELMPIYKKLVEDKKLYLDVIAYMDKKAEEEIKENFKENIKKYKNHFKIGGIKIFLDGSPQSRTAWMRTPYIDDKEYYGYGTMNDDDVKKDVESAYEEKLQILAHCNGDKAAEQYINAIKSTNKNIEEIRPVLIHGQLLGTDQLKEVKENVIIPSFFIAHIYHWGDIHIKNFGFERASKISPAGSAMQNDIKFTFHQDAPVIEPNMFETIWCAVNRKTKDGKILGEEEKISVLDAIKAVTINSAYQYFEENYKGSIKEGKFADLIIVDKNPLKVEKEEIRNIKVLETIKSGETVWKKE